MMDTMICLTVLPRELLSLVLEFLNVSTIFSLSRSSKGYLNHKVISDCLTKVDMDMIRLDSASNGHLDLLLWLVVDIKINNWYNERYISEIVSKGHLAIIKYLHKNGCYISKYIGSHAAEHGHLAIIKYLHENGFKWDYWYCSDAARNGHLDVLKYLHENGCPWSSDGCYNAARNGHLDILKYLHECGCQWGRDTSGVATSHNQVEIVKYLHENGCPCNKKKCNYCKNIQSI